VTAPPFAAAGAATATVVVKSYAHVPRRATIAATVDGRLWERRTVELPARGTAIVRLADPPGGGVARVALAGGDALAADDAALAWIPRGPPPEIVLVGDGPLGPPWTSLPFRASARTAAEYAASPPAGPHVVVLRDAAAPPLPPHASVLYAPPPAGAACAGGGAVEAAAVVDWEPAHPAIAALDGLDALALAPVRRLVAPPWGTSVVRVASVDAVFPFLVAGVDAGRRTACLGASLDGALARTDRLPLLLMVLGTLRWLGDGGAPLVIPTGTPASLETADATSDDADLRVTGGALVALRAGIHRLTADGRERVVLANFFDDRESDVGRAEPVRRAATTHTGSTATAAGRREVSQLFLAAAALFFVAEWAAWLRRWA
jgi:hypothetical protein